LKIGETPLQFRLPLPQVISPLFRSSPPGLQCFANPPLFFSRHRGRSDRMHPGQRRSDCFWSTLRPGVVAAAERWTTPPVAAGCSCFPATSRPDPMKSDPIPPPPLDPRNKHWDFFFRDLFAAQAGLALSLRPPADLDSWYVLGSFLGTFGLDDPSEVTQPTTTFPRGRFVFPPQHVSAPSLWLGSFLVPDGFRCASRWAGLPGVHIQRPIKALYQGLLVLFYLRSPFSADAFAPD